MLFKTLILASTASASCLHGLNLFKRADEVRISTFGYGPLNGPFNWASLAPENEACKNGTNQSPINIDSKIPLAKSKPKLTVPRVSESIFENLGSTIEVLANGTTSFEGTDYRLVQFHMHTPSEHHIDGEYYPLEIHMVHQGIADNTKLAVIGLMFQVSAGKSSSIISSLSGSLDKITVPGTKTAIKGGIDYKDVISAIETSDIVQYTGSLTTPPCAEGVTFLLLKNPLDVSVKDFNAIKKIVKFNSRFIQNELGNTNMLEVGGLSGTPGAIMPAGVNATVPQAPAVVADAVPAASPAPAEQNGQAGDKNGCTVHVDIPLSLNLPKIIGGCTMIYKDDSAAAKRDAQVEPVHNPPVTPIGDRAVPVQKRTPKYAN